MIRRKQHIIQLIRQKVNEIDNTAEVQKETCPFTRTDYLDKFHATRQTLNIYRDWLLYQISDDETIPFASIKILEEILKIKFSPERNK